MKNVFIAIAFLLSALIVFDGCAPKSPRPLHWTKKSEENNSAVFDFFTSNVFYAGRQDKASLLYGASTVLKSEGYEYFVIAPIYGIPNAITNFNDIYDYCYPSKMKKDEWSNLETKCQEKQWDSLKVIGFKNQSFSMPMWKVDSILSDKNINTIHNQWLNNFAVPTWEKVQDKK